MTDKIEVEQSTTLYSDIESREVLEMTDRETYLSMSIGQAIGEYSDLYKVELYDLIMENTDVAKKEDLLFLLEKMGRPPEIRQSQKEKKDTLNKLTVFMAFFDISLEFNQPVTDLRRSDKKKIIEWLALLKPDNHLERNLKGLFIKAEARVKEGTETESECYKGVYLRVKKDVLSQA